MKENDFILDTMTWSFSRLESFDQCPYGWYQKYVMCEDGENNAFAEYGSLCHSLLEGYSKGEIDAFDLASEYERRFDEEVVDDFPPNKYVDMRESYFYKGLDYFESFSGILDGDYEVIGVEQKVDFEIDGKKFIGYVDLLVRDHEGKIICCDHKSANLKFKKNGDITKGDAEKLQMYKRQQYLYSKCLIEEGYKPDYLCWNFFNNGMVYKIPFDECEYNEALQWAADTIKKIEAAEEFEPRPNHYFCHNICDQRMACSYGQPETKSNDVEWDTDEP